MVFFRSITVASLLALAGDSNAFAPVSLGLPTPTATSFVFSNIVDVGPTLAASSDDNAGTAPCEAPSDIESVVLSSAKPLRESIVTNIKGRQVLLGDVMEGTSLSETVFDTSVVVFLRHMGWPYCWTYANEWQAVRQQLEDSGVNGPIFVSIGDREKMEVFLEKNPAIDRNNMFVDGYEFAAYEAAGFGKFTDTDPKTAKEVDMKPPDLGFGQWMGYMGAVGKVSPIPKDMKFGQVPEGVLRLGGTFVVKGDDILYQWSDRLPGDHPDISGVVSIALEAS